MKKTMLFGMALGLVAFAATSASATIVGSKHDLSGLNGTTSYGDDGQRICVFCHHPHHSLKSDAAGGSNGLAYSPLWNRTTQASSAYTAYNNGTNMDSTASSGKHNMNGTPAVGGVSLLCLSCHDGTIALNAFSNTSNQSYDATGTLVGKTGTDTIGGIAGVKANFGTDLSNHHPIGMDWDYVTQEDNEIAQKDAVFADSGVTIGEVLTGGNTMECSSCHDVHNGVGQERFLWTSNLNNGSDFCLTCHLK